MPDDKPILPGDGFLGWLGRQIGHVAKAVKTDVSPPPAVVYRADTVEEIPHPTQPGVVLRRTVVDEIIVPTTDRKTID